MEKLKGGLADKKTVEDIARKHSVFVGTIQKALERGIKVESEHTTDKKVAREIAMDHLWEDPEYYEKLEKMEKGKCNSKKEESKEQTMSDASGSFEGPLAFKETILKKDIHKFHNFKSNPKPINEMDGIPGMAYDAPIGTNKKDPLAIDEKSKTASITAASTDKMISTKKGFPRFGGPDAKFVEIDAKCKEYPYCNQGDSGDKFNFIGEINGMKEAIESASKKYGLPIAQIAEIIFKESKEISEQRHIFDDPGNIKAMRSQRKAVELARGLESTDDETEYHITTMEPLDFKTKNKESFNDLKSLLRIHGVKFQEDVRSVEHKSSTELKPPEDDDLYASEDEIDPEDDIFANMKK